VASAWIEPPERLHQGRLERRLLGAAQERQLGVRVRRGELVERPELLLALRPRLEEVQGHPEQHRPEPGVQASPPLVLGELRQAWPDEEPLPRALEHLGPQLLVRPEPAQRPGEERAQPGIEQLERPGVAGERGCHQVEVGGVDRDPVGIERRPPAREEAEERPGFDLERRVRVPREFQRRTELQQAGAPSPGMPPGRQVPPRAAVCLIPAPEGASRAANTPPRAVDQPRATGQGALPGLLATRPPGHAGGAHRPPFGLETEPRWTRRHSPAVRR